MNYNAYIDNQQRRQSNTDSFDDDHMTLDSGLNKSITSDINDFALYINGSLTSSQNELEYLKQQIG